MGGSMNAALALLGKAMLILFGLAVVLAVVILILYEARCIIRLSKQISRSTWMADQASGGSPQIRDKRGGP
jgi:Na+-transporting methylmalonyl-CoA/oxaloacetate decarboxylase gamma subunit